MLDAVHDGVYELALRMLGHPSDAEDAAQEILVIVLTHLGSFRGDSAFQTWVWRIAANRLARTRRGRRETIAFDTLDENLRTGLADDAAGGDPESAALTRELRLRCTEAMLLSLDRELRIAYVLGDILNLSGDEAAEVLEIDPAAYRKRLSRARALSHIPFQDIVACAERGVYRTAPAHVFELHQIVEAHRLIESGAARGKIVVRAPS